MRKKEFKKKEELDYSEENMTFEQYIAKYGADILSQIAQMNGTDALTFWRLWRRLCAYKRTKARSMPLMAFRLNRR